MNNSTTLCNLTVTFEIFEYVLEMLASNIRKLSKLYTTNTI